MMMTDDDSPGALMPNISAQNVPPDKNSLDEYLATLEVQAGVKDRAAMTPVVTGIAGRRTGLVIARQVHKDEDGFDDIDEFWEAEAADNKENKRKSGYTPSSTGSSTPFTSPPPLDIDTPAASTVSHGGRARESSMASAASLPLDGTPGMEEDEDEMEDEEGGEEAQDAAAPPAPEVGEGKKAQPPVQKEVITPAPAKPVDPHALFSTDQGPPVSHAPRRLDFMKRNQEQRREEAKEEEDEEEEEEQAEKKLDRKKKLAKEKGAAKALKPVGKPEEDIEEEEDEEGKQSADDARRSPAGSRDDDDWGVDGGDADDYFANNDQISPLSSGVKKSPSSKVSGDVEDEEDEEEEEVVTGRSSTGKKPRRIVQSEGEEEEEPPSPVAKPRPKTKEKASPASGAKRKMEEKKGQRKGKRDEESAEDEEEEEDDDKEDVVPKGDKGRKNKKKDQEKSKEKKAKTPTAKAKKGEAAKAKSKKNHEPEPDDETVMSLSDDGETSVGEFDDDDDEGRSHGDRTADRSKKQRQITRKLRLSEFCRQNLEEPEEDAPAGVRRSKRRHIQPLQFWKNEREVVTLDAASVPKVEEVILANPTPAASRKRKNKRHHPSKGKQKRKRRHDDDEDLEDEEEVFDASNLNQDYNYKDGDKAFVWDEEEAGFCEMRVVSYRDKLREMALPVEGDYEAPLASQCFSRTPHGEGCAGWMSGCVRLPPGAVKDAEGVGLCSQVFFVMEAQPKAFEVALARAEETSFNPKTAQRFLLSQGDNFFIPPNNVYRLQNHSADKDAVVNWVVIRPWPLEGADAESEEEAAK